MNEKIHQRIVEAMAKGQTDVTLHMVGGNDISGYIVAYGDEAITLERPGKPEALGIGLSVKPAIPARDIVVDCEAVVGITVYRY